MKIPTKLEEMIVSKKIYIYLACLFIIGVFFMFLPESYTNNNEKSKEYSAKKEPINLGSEKNDELKINLINILEQVEGVGDVDLIINYSTTPRKIPLLENKNTDSEKIINSSQGSVTEPYIVTEESPQIEGVVIVAQGGGDYNIISTLRSTVSSYLGIPVHKVNVLKMKIKE